MRYLIFTLMSILVLTGAGCNAQPEQQPQPAEQPETSQEKIPHDEGDTANKNVETDTDEETEKDAGQPISENDQVSAETTLYEGTWFDVEYPSAFTARPQPAADSLNDRAQTDEAYFTSPDGSVEFFVYSPLWSGEPEDYLEVKPSEELVNEKETVVTEEENPDQFGDTITRWVTVKAKDGSYTRSYVSKREQVDTGSEVHHVFGIKYENQAAYDKYKDAYINFKESLIQYAD